MKKYNEPWEESSDVQTVLELQYRNEMIERNFYRRCYAYFMDHLSAVFGHKEGAKSPEDIFQEAFLALWTEIDSKKIHVRDGKLCRYNKAGESHCMTANLFTYLMAIARFKYYELLREELFFADVEAKDVPVGVVDEAPELDALDVARLTVEDMPPRCREILTMFYCENKSLEEILLLRGGNTSKDGVKSAKSKCLAQFKTRMVGELEKFHVKWI